MDVIKKIFFEFWAFIDNPLNFPFFNIIYDDGQSLLIKNILVTNAHFYIWISSSKIDLSIVSKLSNDKPIVLQYYSITQDISDMINIYNQYEVTLIECAPVYENTSKKKQSISCDKNYSIEIASKCEFNKITNETEINTNHDYMEQIRAAFDDESTNVYVLKYKQQPVSFLVLWDIVSSKYEHCYKHISPIITLPQYRQKGYASYLLKSIINKHMEYDFIYVSDSIENLASNNVAKASGFSKLGYNIQIQLKKL